MYDNIKLDKYGCREMEMRRFMLYHSTTAASYLKIAKNPQNVCISQQSSWICIKMNENPIRWCGSFCLHDAGEYQLAYYWVLFCVHQPRKLKTSQFCNFEMSQKKRKNEWTERRKEGRRWKWKAKRSTIQSTTVVTSLARVNCFLATSFGRNRIFCCEFWKDGLRNGLRKNHPNAIWIWDNFL